MVDYISTRVKFTKLSHYVENDANLKYATAVAACFEICAAIAEPITVHPGEHRGRPTGIKLAA